MYGRARLPYKEGGDHTNKVVGDCHIRKVSIARTYALRALRREEMRSDEIDAVGAVSDHAEREEVVLGGYE